MLRRLLIEIDMTTKKGLKTKDPKLPFEENENVRSVKEDFPDLDAMMFTNKSAHKRSKAKEFRKFKQTRKSSS